MQEIQNFAGNVQYWSDHAKQLDTLPRLQTAARVAVELPDSGERTAAKGILLRKAGEIGCRGELSAMFRVLETELMQARLAAAAPDMDEMPYLDRDGKGCVRRTIGNYLTILQTDPFFASLRYDELAEAPVTAVTPDGEGDALRRWTDADDAAALQHIEQTYGLYDRRKYRDAFLQRMRQVRFHPVKQAIEAVQWDGESRIHRFLFDWAAATDSAYTRAVSRLIFAGGIFRLYEPGCKFDYLPVLIGTKQGEGKSTLARWLALRDEWFGEITVFEGKEAVEQLQGVFIAEVAELLALKTARDQEAIKSFLTRQRDRYRRPYAERVEDLPRRSIMIGTTNNRRFLSDKTGNRRFLPVEVHSVGAALYHLEEKARAYILQCWAEALALYRRGELSPVADGRLRSLFRAAQDDAMEDDWRVGAIERCLDALPEKSCVCIRDLVRDALQVHALYPSEPNRRERLELSQIMDGMDGWKRVSSFQHPKYGWQRGWKKCSVSAQKQPLHEKDC